MEDPTTYASPKVLPAQFSKAGMPSRHQPALAPDTAIVRSAFSKAGMPQPPPAQMQMMPPPAQAAHMPPPAQMQMMPFNGQQFQMMAAMHVRPAPNGFYMGNQFVNQQGQLMPWESKISTDTVSLIFFDHVKSCEALCIVIYIYIYILSYCAILCRFVNHSWLLQ